jgi:hypothetical protein
MDFVLIEPELGSGVSGGGHQDSQRGSVHRRIGDASYLLRLLLADWACVSGC